MRQNTDVYRARTAGARSSASITAAGATAGTAGAKACAPIAECAGSAKSARSEAGARDALAATQKRGSAEMRPRTAASHYGRLR